MEFICQFDNSKHNDIESLHRHIKKFRIKRADYYQEYYPRYDLLTKELISFKDYNQYFNQDFVNKNNLKKYLKDNLEDGKKWAIEWLRKRKESKNLEYPPTQSELRSLNGPSMIYFNKIGGYYNIAEKLGFKSKFQDKKLKFNKIDDSIIVDTREQKEIKSKNFKVEFTALNIGDYCLKNNNSNVYIERKSLSDFCGTLSKGLERFDRELERAKESDSYIIMMVENNITDALSFNYLPQTKWVKASPDFIFKNLRDLLTKYPRNFQVLFVNGRIEFADKMMKIFQLGEEVKSIDLQWKYEMGEL